MQIAKTVLVNMPCLVWTHTQSCHILFKKIIHLKIEKANNLCEDEKNV